MTKSKEGFTLIETLLVLAIVIGLLYFPIQRWQRWQDQLAGEYFFQQFERQLLSAQQMAISMGNPTEVMASSKRKVITLRLLTPSNVKYNDELPLPDCVRSKKYTSVTFNGRTGNTGEIKYYEFETTYSDENVIFQFYLGSGRFERK